MPTLRTSVIAASAAALVAGLAAAVVPNSVAEEPPPPPPSHNWLVLQTGAANQVSYYSNVDLTDSNTGVAPKPTPSMTQTLAGDCKFGLKTSGDELLALSGQAPGKALVAPKDVALATGSIGVPEKTSGTSCSRVDKDETLTLKLVDNFANEGLPKVMTSALLEVDLKQDARILATATRYDAEKKVDETVGKFELQSGTSIGATRSDGVKPEDVLKCREGVADSGADTQARDNCYWPISAPGDWFQETPSNTIDVDGLRFDKLTLKSLNGSFALQGGAETGTPGFAEVADPTGANTTAAFLPQRSTFFEISYDSEGEMGCDVETNTATQSGDGTVPDILVNRLSNADPAQDCVKVPYTLRNGDGFARFLKPLDEQDSAQFVLDMMWRLPADPYRRTSDPDYNPPQVPQTTINFESDDPRTDIILGSCPDPILTAGRLTGLVDPLSNPAVVDLDDVLTGKQFACVGPSSSTVDDQDTPDDVDDLLVVNEQIYLLGDAWVRK